MGTILPDLESLRCFVEAAGTLNFRAAAGRVGLTPAALGRRIQLLEDQLEVVLFERTTRRVELTEAGLALLPRAEETLQQAEGCTRAARGELGPAPMEITLGTRHELGLSWIRPMLADLEAHFPHVLFHLYFGSGEDLALRIIGQEIDCAVSSQRIIEPQLDTVQVHREDYRLVGAKGLLECDPVKSIDDLSKHVLIDVDKGVPLFRYWSEAGGAERVPFFAGHRWLGTIEAIRSMVMEGQGVAVLPLYLVQADLSAGRLGLILPKLVPDHDFFRLIFRRSDPRIAFFRGLAAHMQQHPLQ